MVDPTSAIRKGYVSKLSAISVPVFDKAVNVGNTYKKYVVISNQTITNDRTKDRFAYLCTVTVDVIVRTVDITGSLAADNIAGEICGLINPLSTADYITANGFQVVNTQIVSSDSLHNMSNSEHVYRRLLTFQHKVVEA